MLCITIVLIAVAPKRLILIGFASIEGLVGGTQVLIDLASIEGLVGEIKSYSLVCTCQIRPVEFICSYVG